MSRMALVIVAHVVVAGVIALGAVTASAGVGDLTQNLPDLDGDGTDLPGGGNINLPGGGDSGGVDLPGGGGSIDLPGGGGGSVPLPDTGIVPEPTEPVPPDDGGETGGDGDGGNAGAGGGKGGRGSGKAEDDREEQTAKEKREEENRVVAPTRRPDGVPTSSNPTVTMAGFGPAPVGVPNFVIDRFTIPPFLLPIYQACGTEYGVPWYVLASINRIETAFGTNLNVSTAGAQGWMQFMPATWDAYGVDANNDGKKDPYNPVDAICAAANYLKASGAQTDLPGAIFAYNHADWYVDEVLLYARQYANIPGDLVSSITGLTEGARFPVAANSRYADDISERATGEGVPPSATSRGINIYSREGAPAIAVNDGVVRRIGQSKELGKFVVLEDNYGNRFTYAELGSVAEAYPVMRERKDKRSKSGPSQAHSEDSKGGKSAEKSGKADKSEKSDQLRLTNTEDLRERVSAFPDRTKTAPMTMDPSKAALERLGYESFEREFGPLRFNPKRMELRELEKGSKVVAGTILGEVGARGNLAPHLNFAIRPAGRGAPQINPKPILDGWKLLEATHLYRAMGENPFEDGAANAGQVLLMSKEQAARALVAESRVSIYECGIQDIRSGQIDVRIMRLLLYLARTGFDLTVTSLKCGHGVYTSSGNISAHSVGSAVDIAEINGLPVLGNQGQGSITETLIEQILELQGAMTPDQIISLMEMGGPTFAMGDHADHVHVGYSISGAATPSTPVEVGKPRVLDSSQWRRLIRRLGEIENPKVKPTSRRRASVAHKGE